MGSELNATKVVADLADLARRASRTLIAVGAEERAQALVKIAEEIEASVIEILAANKNDMERATKEGMAESMQDRLLLTEDRIKAIANGASQVSKLPKDRKSTRLNSVTLESRMPSSA